MSVRYRLLLAAAAAAFAVGPGAPGAVLGAEARPEEDTGISGEAAAEILERARLATMEENFTGVVEVAWHDGEAQRTAQVDVLCAGGRIRLGEDVAVGDGGRRLVRSAGEWLMLWRDEAYPQGPSPAEKYRFSLAAGDPLAGRATDVLVVHRRGEQYPSERLYLDRGSGLLLRRELLDARQQVQRSIGFVRISPGARELSTPVDSVGRDPAPAGDMTGPYNAPETLGDGYELVGAYEGDHQVHLFYSDGLHGLSLFEKPGRLSPSKMPDGGHQIEVDGRRVSAYSTAAGEAAVWQGDEVVYTLVSDATFADVAAAVSDLPHAAPAGRLRRVAEIVSSLFRWS